MPRLLRIYLLGCIAIALAFLVLHAREPLRLNVGDPWSDAATLASVTHGESHGYLAPQVSAAYRPTHDPLIGAVYGALGTLGASDVGTFRLVALGFSMLWAWLVFAYARRIWGDTVALLATALLATSVLWMMYADSVDRPPIVHAACFLALWGLAAAIETQQRRHYAAAFAGSFACMFGGLEDGSLLLVGVLFTIYVKAGNPFGRGKRRFVISCALGALAAVIAQSLFAGPPVEWNAGAAEWQAAIDRKLVTLLPTLLRRYALAFTPMFWITLGYATWRALRAPSLASLIEDGMTWLLVVAAVVLYLAAPHTAAPMVRAQPVLPFYAIGTAILIARLLEGRRLARGLAIAWATVAPAWGLYLVLSHPRSVLDRDDVAKTRAYLAANDRNDFVVSNLLADGPIQAAFDRHVWAAPELDNDAYTHLARLQMLNMFDATGTAYVHAVIFTTPESRFVDRSLGQLVVRGRLASVTGWPYLVRAKANEVIRDYDRKVLKNLEAIGAQQVLHLRNFDVYRVERPTVVELAGRSIPAVRQIDLGSPGSNKYKLLGWGEPQPAAEDQLGASTIVGHSVCASPLRHRAADRAGNLCETAPSQFGLSVIEDRGVPRAQLMIRVERVCDLRVTLELASSFRLAQLATELASSSRLAQLMVDRAFAAPLEVSMNDFAASQCAPAKRVSFVIPQRSVQPGVNILTLKQRADVVSLAIEPVCESAR